MKTPDLTWTRGTDEHGNRVYKAGDYMIRSLGPGGGFDLTLPGLEQRHTDGPMVPRVRWNPRKTDAQLAANGDRNDRLYALSRLAAKAIRRDVHANLPAVEWEMAEDMANRRLRAVKAAEDVRKAGPRHADAESAMKWAVDVAEADGRMLAWSRVGAADYTRFVERVLSGECDRPSTVIMEGLERLINDALRADWFPNCTSPAVDLSDLAKHYGMAREIKRVAAAISAHGSEPVVRVQTW